MILLQQIEKSFGRQKVLAGVSLDFSDGRPVALVGPNGSGKTTLLKCLLGLVKPDSGVIQFMGQALGNDFKYRSQIGYMPQFSRYPDRLKVGHVFDMIRDIRKGASHLDEELINLFRIREIYDKRVYSLSGGMRQKVSAALAFLFDPPVLILDEPTAGLDPSAAEILREKIRKETSRGKLLLVTSHNLSDLEELAEKLVYIVEGKIRFDGTLEDLKNITGESRLSRSLPRISANWTN